jgi:AcrR family transcriptional regulator
VTTRDKLLDSAGALLATEGLAGVSARTIAARAEVNQALVFYHFGTVSELLEAAVRRSVDLAVATYRDRLADVSSVAELLSLGRELHRTERERGNVAQMAQVMAGAQRDEALARAGKHAMQQWSREVEAVLRRLLPGSPLDGLVDPRGLARAVTSGFIGLELYDGVDPRGASASLGALEQIAALVAALEGLPPLVVRAARGRAQRSVGRPASSRGVRR